MPWGEKNIKSVLGNLPENPANFQQNDRSWEFLLWTAVARLLVIGGANKLAEVLEHVLGVNKYKKSLENSAEKASNDNTKKQTPKKS